MLNTLPLVVTSAPADACFDADTDLAKAISDKWGFSYNENNLPRQMAFICKSTTTF
ncbi:hypothetical protein [Alteromonas gracilis]|uniref:hypothetical protein n=1 Tax=Alteromonas gracilis TaxID=1479524 RepID=UPI003D65DA69